MTKALICTTVSILSLAASNVAVASPKDGDKTQDSAVSAPQSPKASSKETRYCVKETLTGTRIESKVCKTLREWKAEGFDPLNP